MSFHTFGDSHANWPFCHIKGTHIHWLGPVLCYTFGRDRLKCLDISADVKDGDVACFCFGEIDCRCHVHKHITPSMDYKRVIDQIVNSYFNAIFENERKAPNVQMIVYNVVPPRCRDEMIENKDFPFLGTDAERVAYVRYFNESLSWHCDESGFSFINVYDKYAAPDGTLRQECSDGNVHIADSSAIEELLRANHLLD